MQKWVKIEVINRRVKCNMKKGALNTDCEQKTASDKKLIFLTAKVILLRVKVILVIMKAIMRVMKIYCHQAIDTGYGNGASFKL